MKFTSENNQKTMPSIAKSCRDIFSVSEQGTSLPSCLSLHFVCLFVFFFKVTVVLVPEHTAHGIFRPYVCILGVLKIKKNKI